MWTSIEPDDCRPVPHIMHMCGFSTTPLHMGGSSTTPLHVSGSAYCSVVRNSSSAVTASESMSGSSWYVRAGVFVGGCAIAMLGGVAVEDVMPMLGGVAVEDVMPMLGGVVVEDAMPMLGCGVLGGA